MCIHTYSFKYLQKKTLNFVCGLHTYTRICTYMFIHSMQIVLIIWLIGTKYVIRKSTLVCQTIKVDILSKYLPFPFLNFDGGHDLTNIFI